MASSSGSVLAGRKRKSVSRDPDQLSNGGAAAVPPFVVDLTGDSPAKPSSSGRRLTDDESEDDILVMGDRVRRLLAREIEVFTRLRANPPSSDPVDRYRRRGNLPLSPARGRPPSRLRLSTAPIARSRASRRP